MRLNPRLLLAGFLMSLALATPVVRAADGPANRQEPAALERTVKVTMKYLVCLPKDYDQQASWPLLIFLHGSGERGDDLNKVKAHGPPKLIEAGKEFPFIVVSPQCPNGQWWEPFELDQLYREITEKYKVDRDRVYLTGLSMGGFGTWAWAAHSPQLFAAIVPICGSGDPGWAGRLGQLSIWVFHGAKDGAVPIEGSERLVEALKKKKEANVKFTIYPEAGHDSWSQTYANPELYEWLLQQKRAPKPAPEPKK